MANKAVVQVPVDLEGFQKFMEVFEVYNKKVEELPDAWKKLDDAMKASGSGFQQKAKETQDALEGGAASAEKLADEIGESALAWTKLGEEIEASTQRQEQFRKATVDTNNSLAIAATSAAVIVEAIQKATTAQVEALAAHKTVVQVQKESVQAQKDFGRETVTSTNRMDGLAKSAKGVLHSVGGVMRLLGRAGSFLGLGAALGTIGSGFGIAELSGGASRQTIGGLGVGLSPGELNAYRVNLAPFIGESPLQGAAQAQVDLTKQGYLATLTGLSPQVLHESAAKLVTQEIEAIRSAWQANPTINTAQAQAALALGFSPQAIRLIGTMPADQLRGYERSAVNDAGALGFSSRVSRDWLALDNQLRKAGVTIESSLIQGLAPLTPQIGRLTQEVSDFIAAFLRNDASGIIDSVASGLKRLADWVGSPQFSTDVKDFGDEVSRIVTKLGEVLKWFENVQEPSWLKFLIGNSNQPSQGAQALGERPARIHDELNWVRRQIGAPEVGTKTGFNNPGDIRAPGGGFATYSTEQAGWQALASLLQRNYQHMTLAQIITKYAPPSENDTASYIRNVAAWTGLDPNAMLDLSDRATLEKVMQGIARQEHSQNKVSLDYIDKMLGGPAPAVSSPPFPRRQIWGTQVTQSDLAAPKPSPSTPQPDLSSLLPPRHILTQDTSSLKAAGWGANDQSGEILAVLRRMERQQARAKTTVTVQNSTSARVAVQANAAGGGP